MHTIAPTVLLTVMLALAAGCGSDDPGRNGDAGTDGGGSGGTGSGGTTAGTGTAGTGTAGTSAGTGTAGTAGTGTAGTGTAGTGMPGDGELLPLATGNTWTFRTTNAGVVSDKTQTVGELQMVGGTGPNSQEMAFHIVTEKDDGTDRTESWQAVVGTMVVRYREHSFSATSGQLAMEEHWDPYKLRVDAAPERTMEGASWVEEYSETKLPVGGVPSTATSSDSWTVIAENEEVTVPAGTFEALVLQKGSATSTKRYWFVRGIGKVKEDGDSQLEELVSYDVTP